jgi:hypothetical protein
VKQKHGLYLTRAVAAGAAALAALAVVLTPAAASAAPTANTSYSFTSEPGDYIGGGQTRSFPAPPATISVSGSAASLTVAVTSGDDMAPRLVGTVHYRAFPLSYHFASDAGDYIGGGRTTTYTNSTSVFGLSGTTAGLSYSVSGQRDDWTVELAPPAGEQLHVGTYTNAQRAAFREPGHPGLDVGGDGRGCNTLTGSFTIRELVADATGAVKALSATFEQHCEGGTPALHGTIHYYA